MDAIIEIHEALLKAGLTDEEADALVARFLQEEAFDYVESMRNIFGNAFKPNDEDSSLEN